GVTCTGQQQRGFTAHCQNRVPAEQRKVLRGIGIHAAKALSRTVHIVKSRYSDPIYAAARRIALHIARVGLDKDIRMFIPRLDRQSGCGGLVEAIADRWMNRAEAAR